MKEIINIEKTGSLLKINELEEILSLLLKSPDEAVLINKALLINMLEISIGDYWTMKISGEYQ